MNIDLRYPVGRYSRTPSPTREQREAGLAELEALPANLAAAVAGLSDKQLDTPYRPDGWTVRQVVHHVPDSHINAYIRMKLAATEDRPPMKTYEEKAWAMEPEARTAPVALSLDLTSALHARWTAWLRQVDESVLSRAGTHPEWDVVSIDELIQLYAWHSRHHVAHIIALRAREGW